MLVAGGVYREICQFPEYRAILGSGGRAAAALSELHGDVCLQTYAPPQRLGEVQTSLAVYNFDLQTSPSAHLVAFRYVHGLATPIPEPSFNLIRCEEPIDTKASLVLRFGMVEGSARVNADIAVYDPQAPLNPQRFSTNGSKANRLAYVINASEARLITEKTDVKAQLQWIHEDEGAAVVVIKSGPHGAFVSDGQQVDHIPCFKTSSVWPIGSGDIFSAIFAFYWGIRGMGPKDAAYKASLAAAHYCSTQVLPIPVDFEDQVKAEPLNPSGSAPTIYLAGPFFTLSQRWLVDNLHETLETLGLTVFSPVHDVGEGPACVVAPADLAGLKASKVLFAVLDGLDAGTLVEIGYAIANNIPVVAFSQREGLDDLTMLEGTGCLLEHDLVTAIYKAAWIALEK
jgi:hypothetical protein